MKRYKIGFTLAEVLIVLAIIGVVAAITIPALMQNTHQIETKAKLRKAFSELSQAHEQLLTANGGHISGLCSTWDYKCFKNLYVPYLKVAKSCESPNNDQCITSNVLVWGFESGSSLILADGTALNFYGYDADCATNNSYLGLNSCGAIVVDVNGPKPPNAWSKDVFWLEATDSKIIFKNKYEAEYMYNDTTY